MAAYVLPGDIDSHPVIWALFLLVFVGSAVSWLIDAPRRWKGQRMMYKEKAFCRGLRVVDKEISAFTTKHMKKHGASAKNVSGMLYLTNKSIILLADADYESVLTEEITSENIYGYPFKDKSSQVINLTDIATLSASNNGKIHVATNSGTEVKLTFYDQYYDPDNAIMDEGHLNAFVGKVKKLQEAIHGE